ncbi:MAG: hypothetical protein M1814_003213 [Vezdaea aestivalis]|nr:MAG: hypothetical protein M1814_003213 [Vezdaea aestivalis]
MVLPKSKTQVGLGNSLMSDLFGQGKGADRRKGSANIRRTGHNGESYVTDGPKQDSWAKLRSVTEQGPLDEFLNTAELASRDFTAVKMNSMSVSNTGQDSLLLPSAAEEQNTLKKHSANRKKLTVPRRPAWTSSTTKEQLNRQEKEALLTWRRGLAQLEEFKDLLMTPFERNIEVWRQLWRVIERSDLVVQIVDARNPLLFRSEDLERYVKEVDPQKNNLLLINKADMMTVEQREAWADYLEGEGIRYTFFSAALAKAANESQVDESDEGEDTEEVETSHKESEDRRTRIITVDELEELFLKHAPTSLRSDHSGKTAIGLVGYPNVGKSSTINALIGAKKVSVSATPGKTKHFQTLHLSDAIILVDCPGLVFPNFATTKADLVCNGILPIDQLREFIAPSTLVAQRLPKKFLEAVYGIQIKTQHGEEGGSGIPSAEELLFAYARARGFFTTGKGQPDAPRAARYILKDYVKGKLLYCQPPPLEPPLDPRAFNEGLYTGDHAIAKQKQDFVGEDENPLDEATSQLSLEEAQGFETPQTQGAKGSRLEKSFLGPKRGAAGHMKMPFNYKYSEQGMAASTDLSGRKAKTLAALQNNVDPSDIRTKDKKHSNPKKRKTRTLQNHDPED